MIMLRGEVARETKNARGQDLGSVAVTRFVPMAIKPSADGTAIRARLLIAMLVLLVLSAGSALAPGGTAEAQSTTWGCPSHATYTTPSPAFPDGCYVHDANGRPVPVSSVILSSSNGLVADSSGTLVVPTPRPTGLQYVCETSWRAACYTYTVLKVTYVSKYQCTWHRVGYDLRRHCGYVRVPYTSYSTAIAGTCYLRNNQSQVEVPIDFCADRGLVR